MAKKFSEFARERRADQSAEGREAERAFRATYAFGRVIYVARKARSLRQSDLAELSGVAQADISRIERGMIAPTVPTLIKLADALGARSSSCCLRAKATPPRRMSAARFSQSALARSRYVTA